MSSCFCTGRCKELGYCPHTNIGKVSFGKWYCDYCDKYHTSSLSKCPKKEMQKSKFREGVKRLQEKMEKKTTPNIKKDDIIWFRNDRGTVIERYVHEVKDNVFGVGDKPKSRGYNTYWYEFDNVEIIEVEKND